MSIKSRYKKTFRWTDELTTIRRIFYSELVTEILFTYRCTICDLEEDQVKDSVKAALQTMNLKLYQETNRGEHQVKTTKVL